MEHGFDVAEIREKQEVLARLLKTKAAQTDSFRPSTRALFEQVARDCAEYERAGGIDNMSANEKNPPYKIEEHLRQWITAPRLRAPRYIGNPAKARKKGEGNMIVCFDGGRDVYDVADEDLDDFPEWVAIEYEYNRDREARGIWNEDTGVLDPEDAENYLYRIGVDIGGWSAEDE